MAVTREQARAELARRELSRRASVSAVEETVQPDSVATQGLGYVKEHPFKSILQGLPETITGKTMEQRAVESTQAPGYMQSDKAPFDRFIPRARDAAESDILGGQVIDAVTAPANAIVGPMLKGAGMLGSGAVKMAANSPIGKPIVNYIAESKAVKQGLDPLLKAFTKPMGLPKEELVRKIEEGSKEAVEKLRADKKLLDKSVFEESDKAAVKIQEELPKYFKRNSTVYGHELDKISDELVKSNNQITRGELSSILDDVRMEAQEDMLAAGKPMEEIEAFARKHSINPKQIGVDDSGAAIMDVPDPNQPLDFKEVVNDVKAIRNSLSSKAKMGQRYSPEDVIAAKFGKRWGDYLETKVPEFKSLNQEYAPVIQTMKTAGKYFKPYSAGVDKLQGVSFLRNIAQDKLQTSEKKLLDMLQEGTNRFPGIGNQTNKLENIKSLQGKVSKDIDDTIKEYTNYKQKAKDLLGKENELKRQKQKVINVLKVTGITGAAIGGPAYIAKKLSGN